MRALVIGAGQIGRAVALRLIEHGSHVTVAHQGSSAIPKELRNAGVESLVLDRDDDSAFEAAVKPGFDAAVDTVAFDGRHAKQWLKVKGQIGRLAVISTGSVYADAQGRTLDEAREIGSPEFPIPIREDQVRTAAGGKTYSTRKVELEDGLLRHFDDSLTILRPMAVYGPGSRSPREWWFLSRILAGVRTIPLAYEGRNRFHTSGTANIAELCCTALNLHGVHVLNAADPDAPSVAEIGAAIFESLGYSADFLPYPGPPKAMKDYTPWSVEHPLIADMSAAMALGYKPVGNYRALVGETCLALLHAAEQGGWRTAFPGLATYPPAIFEPVATQ
jgi:nucleoside-diphosphate-sugar epimerase